MSIETGTLAMAGGGDVQAIIDVAQEADAPTPLTPDARTVDHTTVWVHQASGRVVAVLNDNAPEASAWGDHRLALQLVYTDEWKRWAAHDGRLLDQETFAEHIEESQVDVVEPDAADLLEIAQTFHATTTSSFKSAKRLNSGEVQLEYVEDIAASAGRKGDLSIPTELVLGIPIFLGEEVVRLTALLRYRIRDGKLAIGYKLVRPGDVVRQAIDAVAEQLRGEFPRVFLGEPA
jgi:uncharacterized protein YfdQ (DUF2303 family)